MRRKVLSWFSTCLIVLGMLLPAVTAVADHQPGSWSVQSSGPVYSGGDTTWTYTVSKTGDPHALSHLSLEICQNYGRIHASPFYNDRGPDGSLPGSPYVLKWEGGVTDGTVITVTYPGLWASGSQSYYVKAGQQVYSGTLSGPSCSAASADFAIAKTVSTTNDASTGAGTAELTGGGTAYYFYTITNTGNVPVTISSATDDKLGSLSFSPATIAPGGTATASASKSFPALPPGSGDQTEVNTVSATVTWNGETIGPKTAQATVINHPSSATPDFAVTKLVSTSPDPATGQPSVTLAGGGTAYYFYTVTNTGNVPLTVSSAVDDKLGSLAFSPSLIQPGGTATAAASKSFAALPAGEDDEQEVNTVTVSASYDGQPVGPHSAQATVINQAPAAEPDFTLTKTVSTTNDPATGQASVTLTGGGTVYYFYTVTNSGNVPLMFWSAEDDKLGVLTFSPDPIEPGETATATASKTFPALDPNEGSASEINTVTVEMWTTREVPAGTKTAQATVINNPPIEQHNPGFMLTKTVSTQNDPATGAASVTLYGGGTVYYFYTVTNTGDVPLTITQATDDRLGALSFSPLTVPVGGTATATASKTFTSPAQAETETNIAEVVAAYNNAPLQPRQATATVYNNPGPSFTVSKLVSSANDPATGQSSLLLPGSGGTVYYFYTVTNTGPVPVTIATATDDKLGLLSFTPATIPVGGTATASAAKSFPALGPTDDPVAETNTVSVTVTYNGQTYGPQTDSVTVTVQPPEGQPDFTLTKKVSTTNNPATGQSSVTLTGGGTVYYFYTFTNTGDVPLTIRLANDDRLGDLTFSPLTVQPGGTATATASKSFAALLPDAPDETEVNTVTVTAGDGQASLTRTAQASVTNQAAPGQPGFTVTKTVSKVNDPATGQSSISISGGTMYYFYTITNTGNVRIALTGANDDKLGALSLPLSLLDAGASVTLTASKSFPVLAKGNSSQTEVNTVTITASYQDQPFTRTAQATVINVAPPPDPPRENPDFVVSKRVSTTNNPATGQSSVTLTGGGTVYYFYTFSNTGNVPLTITGANDDRLGSISFSPTEVPPGGTATATASKTFPALAPGAAAQSEVNVLSASASYNGQIYGPKTAQATVINQSVAPIVDFVVTKTVSDTNDPATGSSGITLVNGGTAYYFYTVTNTGNVPLTITEAVDDQLGDVTFTPSVLPPGGTATAMKSKTFTAGGAALAETNIIRVTTSDGRTEYGPKTGTAVVTVPAMPQPDPSIRVWVCSTFPLIGGVVVATGPDGQTVTAALPGPDGTYLLQGLMAGNWQVTLTGPGVPASATMSLTLRADGTVPGNAYMADFSRVCPAVTGTLEGRVCSPPRPGAVITATGPNGHTATVTVESDGVLGKWRAWVLENLPMGSWTVTLNTPGADPVSQTVAVNPSETTAVPDFTLACTGEPGPMNYYLLGALMVLAGVLLRLPWDRLRAKRA